LLILRLLIAAGGLGSGCPLWCHTPNPAATCLGIGTSTMYSRGRSSLHA
jgi:hypothetical protein